MPKRCGIRLTQGKEKWFRVNTSVSGDSGAILNRPTGQTGTCTRSGGCGASSVPAEVCGGGGVDFNTGVDTTWTGKIIDGVCVKDDAVSSIDDLQWNCQIPQQICGGGYSLPDGFCSASSSEAKSGMLIKNPGGQVVDMWQYCDSLDPATYVCEKSFVDDYPLTDLLSELLGDLGFSIPSIDATICNNTKEKVLREMVAVLAAVGDVGGIIASVLPTAIQPFTAVVIDTFNPLDDIADIVRATIELGRGNFDEAVLAYIDALPGLGGILSVAIEQAGFKGALEGGLGKLDKSISPADKVRILDFIDDSLGLGKMAAGPLAPIVVLVQVAIMFGRRKWDRAVATFLSMGMDKYVTKVVNKILPILTAYGRKLGLITATGDLTKIDADTFTTVGAALAASAAAAYTGNIYTTPN